jgi:hypothetical protein
VFFFILETPHAAINRAIGLLTNRFSIEPISWKWKKLGKKKPAREGRLTTFIAMLRIEVYVEAL